MSLMTPEYPLSSRPNSLCSFTYFYIKGFKFIIILGLLCLHFLKVYPLNANIIIKCIDLRDQVGKIFVLFLLNNHTPDRAPVL